MRFFRRTILLLFSVFILSCESNPYDTSTPKTFVTSLGIIGQQPEDHNPLPYFYEPKVAEAILLFDQTAEEGLKSFNSFRNTLAEKFPKYVKSNREGKIKIATDGFAGFNTRNFTYSASTISAQMKERKSLDYEFVSATEVDEDNISQLQVKIKGKTTTIPLKKTDQGFVMHSTEDQLENINESVAKMKKMNEVFLRGISLINSGELTEANFKEKIEDLSNQYFDVVRE
jgi:hypothetical protein